MELQLGLKPHHSHLARSECGHGHLQRSTVENEKEGVGKKTATQNVDGENTFASFCSGNLDQHPGRYRSVINHHTTTNIHLRIERQHQRQPVPSCSPAFQFHSSQARKIRNISTRKLSIILKMYINNQDRAKRKVNLKKDGSPVKKVNLFRKPEELL